MIPRYNIWCDENRCHEVTANGGWCKWEDVKKVLSVVAETMGEPKFNEVMLWVKSHTLGRDIHFMAWDVKQQEMMSPERFDSMFSYCECAELSFWVNNFENVLPLQYTGITDSDGNKIYHKWICSYFDDEDLPMVGVVEERDGAWWLMAVNGDKSGSNNSILAYASHVEILGNIYENPDLLGEVKE